MLMNTQTLQTQTAVNWILLYESLFIPIAAAASVENVAPFARKGNMLELFRWMELEEDSYPQLQVANTHWNQLHVTKRHIDSPPCFALPGTTAFRACCKSSSIFWILAGQTLTFYHFSPDSVSVCLVDLPFIPYIWYVRGWPIFIGWSW